MAIVPQIEKRPCILQGERFNKNQKHLVKRLSRKGNQPPNINGHITRMKGE